MVEKFCVELQICWNILHKFGFIPHNPDLLILAQKFRIPKWQENKIQRFFIISLQASWNELRKNLVQLFTQGEGNLYFYDIK